MWIQRVENTFLAYTIIVKKEHSEDTLSHHRAVDRASRTARHEHWVKEPNVESDSTHGSVHIGTW